MFTKEMLKESVWFSLEKRRKSKTLHCFSQLGKVLKAPDPETMWSCGNQDPELRCNLSFPSPAALELEQSQTLQNAQEQMELVYEAPPK